MNIDQKSWKEFKDSGLLWWTNRILHTFGWAIVFEVEVDGEITNVYPARVKFRGFSEESEERGFSNLSNYLKENISEINNEAKITEEK